MASIKEPGDPTGNTFHGGTTGTTGARATATKATIAEKETGDTTVVISIETTGIALDREDRRSEDLEANNATTAKHHGTRNEEIAISNDVITYFLKFLLSIAVEIKVSSFFDTIDQRNAVSTRLRAFSLMIE